MRKSIGFYVFIVVFVFTSGVSINAQVRTRTFNQAPVFQSVSPNPLKLTRGGPWSTVQVNGIGLTETGDGRKPGTVLYSMTVAIDLVPIRPASHQDAKMQCTVPLPLETIAFFAEGSMFFKRYTLK